METDNITDLIGIEAKDIGQVTVNLEALREQGILVSVSVKGTSMFTRRSTRAELGMASDDIRVSHLTAGVSWTIRPELAKAWRSLEGRVRHNLERITYDVTGFRPKRYLPFRAWDQWLEAHEELVSEGYGLTLEILRDRQTTIDETRERFEAVAQRAWAALMSQHQHAWDYGDLLDEPVVLPDGSEYHSFAEFLPDVVNTALRAIPSEDEIREGLSISYEVSLITMMSEIKEELATLAEQRARVATANAEESEARRKEQRIRDLKASAQRANEQWEQEQARIAKAEANAEIARINAQTRIIEENIRQQLGQIVNPYQEMFEQLRDQIAIDAHAILRSLNDHGVVKGPTGKRARNLVETFRLLNVAADTELEELITQLDQRITTRRPDNGQHNVPALQATLEQIALMCSEEGRAIRRMQQAALRIADLPDEQDSSRSRAASAVPDAFDFEHESTRQRNQGAAPDLA
jgi:hypothetical protein